MTTRLRGPFRDAFKQQNQSQRRGVARYLVSDLKETNCWKNVQQTGQARSNLPEPAARAIQALE
jgi:hypothetical protein